MFLMSGLNMLVWKWPVGSYFSLVWCNMIDGDCDKLLPRATCGLAIGSISLLKSILDDMPPKRTNFRLADIDLEDKPSMLV